MSSMDIKRSSRALSRVCIAVLMVAATHSPACCIADRGSYLAGTTGNIKTFVDFDYSLLDIADQLNATMDVDPVFRSFPLGTEEADAFDFAARLAEPDLMKRYSEAQRAALLAGYRELRTKHRLVTPEELSRPGLREFYLYHKGTEFNEDGLIFPPTWFELLKLPPDQRRYRTTWVLYMMGNMAAGVDRHTEAAELYRQVRVATRQGFNDRLGLARASFAREYWNHARDSLVGAMVAAPKAAWIMKSLGDEKEYHKILLDLLTRLSRAKWTPELLRQIHAHPVARSVLFAFLASGRSSPFPGYPEGFLEPVATVGADRMAYFAFSKGDVQKSEKWLAWAEPDSLLTLWLRAETARAKADYAEAAVFYRRWITRYGELAHANPKTSDSWRWSHSIKLYYDNPGHAFRPVYPFLLDDNGLMLEPHQDVHARLGAVLVHRRDFLEALDCFIRADAWPDAAFVAEEILSLDLLKAYVDAHETAAGDGGSTRRRGENPYARLRDLLGRRLVREGDLVTAAHYLPDDFHSLLTRLRLNLDVAKNEAAARLTRSLALFDAARILSSAGLELTGTEGFPDGVMSAGEQFTGLRPASSFRHVIEPRTYWDLKKDGRVISSDNPWQSSDDSPPGAPALTLDNLTRIAPTLRFHFRYQAIALMLQAAEMSPDEHLQAVALFCAADWMAEVSTKLGNEIMGKFLALPGHLPIVAEYHCLSAAQKELHYEFADIVYSSGFRLNRPQDLPGVFFKLDPCPAPAEGEYP